jgi:hypothetical protein
MNIRTSNICRTIFLTDRIRKGENRDVTWHSLRKKRGDFDEWNSYLKRKKAKEEFT